MRARTMTCAKLMKSCGEGAAVSGGVATTWREPGASRRTCTAPTKRTRLDADLVLAATDRLATTARSGSNRLVPVLEVVDRHRVTDRTIAAPASPRASRERPRRSASIRDRRTTPRVDAWRRAVETQHSVRGGGDRLRVPRSSVIRFNVTLEIVCCTTSHVAAHRRSSPINELAREFIQF